jgi:hypothetical protein
MLHRLGIVRRPPLQRCRVFPGNPACHLSIATIGGRASLAPTAGRQRFAVKICPALLPPAPACRDGHEEPQARGSLFQRYRSSMKKCGR